MVISRKEMAYQRVGTTSSKGSIPDISQESKLYLNSYTNGQRSGFDIKEIWEILISEQVMITVEYLPSSLNKVAESRRKVDSSKWVLCRQFLSEIRNPNSKFIYIRVSHRVAQYVAWKPNPYSIATNA